MIILLTLMPINKNSKDMKQFFKFTLASILGVIIGSIFFLVLFLGIMSAVGSSQEAEMKLKDNSIYELELAGSLIERSEDDPLSGLVGEIFNSPNQQNIGLDDLLANIEKAKENPLIKGIYLKGGMLAGGKSSMSEIRQALLDFKESGKFIVAYAAIFEQTNYYLSSVADKIYLNPEGAVDLRGISSEVMFFKKTLEKVGVEMQVVRVGTFKAAVEPFINTSMSDANRMQVESITSSVWNGIASSIAQSRNITTANLNSYADEMMTFQPTTKLIEYHLVDSLVYEDQMKQILSDLVGAEPEKVSHKAMCRVASTQKYQREKVAIIYAFGAIDGGGSSDDGIISTDLVKTIDEVAENEQVKAAVLRVNSPGGSAYGSEQIWRALSNLKKKMPLVVSMGDYAASGGYYISCMADTILAQSNTLTGSIGIFGLIPNMEGLNKKLGFDYEVVKSNKFSDFPSLNRPFKADEKELLQAYVNRGYETFVKRCADGRKLTVDSIKIIGEGRVWTGNQALEIGLVDGIGGIDDAVRIAARMAELTAYETKSYPEKEDFATKLLKGMGEDMQTKVIQAFLGEEYQDLIYLKEANRLDFIQARMPFLINFN